MAKITAAEIHGITEPPAWAVNDDGYWCQSCGNLVARPETAEAGHLPEECSECGYPDPASVAAYHLGGEEDDDCWNCGGEGYVFNCFEEFACIDPEGGCDLCMRRCDICGDGS